MNNIEVFLLLLTCLCVTAFTAEKLKISKPIAFSLAGILLGFISQLREFNINPENILLIFLPPLLMEAAFYTSIREFKANLRPILQLAIGLVVVTSLVVAYIMPYLIPGFTMACGFVLGAIISPPDAVAATSIIDKSRVPKRISTILEGESLVNDATGLVIYQFAVAAVVMGSFNLDTALIDFIWKISMGSILGILIAYFFIKIFPYIKNQPIEIISTFIVPYLAYISAEYIHASGVLAVVFTGLVIGWRSPEIFDHKFRIPAESIWKMTVYIMNGFVFLLIGLKSGEILEGLKGYKISELALYSSVLCVTIVAIRIIYVFVTAYGIRYFSKSFREKSPYPAWQNVFLISWTSIRGVVTLATALALPILTDAGEKFPYRELIIFLSVVVIIFTLVFQGLLLPWLVKILSLSYDYSFLYEDWLARKNATENAIKHLNEDIAKCDQLHLPAFERIRSYYMDKLASLGEGPNSPISIGNNSESDLHPIIKAENSIWQEVLGIEKKVVLEMRKTFKISDDTMHSILRELDLLSARFSEK